MGSSFIFSVPVLILLLLESTVTDASCSNNNSLTHVALTSFYIATSGPTWTDQAGWNGVQGAPCFIMVPTLYGNMKVPAPSDAPYCCWAGITCCAGLPDCPASGGQGGCCNAHV